MKQHHGPAFAASVLGTAMTTLMLSACGTPRETPPFRLFPYPNGTAKLSFLKPGADERHEYGTDKEKLGLICEGTQDTIKISFVKLKKPREVEGLAHLIIKASHPGGPSSKPTDMPGASVEANLPIENPRDVYQKSTDSATCKLEYRKEGKHGKGKFDCDRLQTENERLQTEQASSEDENIRLKPAYLRITGEFDCFIFQEEPRTTFSR